MADTRRTATAVGVLFVVATGFYMAGQIAHGPFLGGEDALIWPTPTGVESSPASSSSSSACSRYRSSRSSSIRFYPILRRHSETLALSYIGLRLLEAAALLIVSANLWAMFALSEAFHSGAVGGRDSSRA